MVQKQKKRSKIANHRWVWIVFLIILLIAAAALLIDWPKILNDSYYSTNKNTAESNLKSTIYNIKIPGSSIYSNVSDIGCDSRNSVGLQSYIHCEIIGESYYKTQTDSKVELEAFNKKLQDEGWSKSLYTTSYGLESSLAASKGEGSGSRPYKNVDEQAHLVLYFELFGENTYIKNYRIKKLIEDRKIEQPTNGESVYGVYITKTYWTCKSKSLFMSLCPEPPSKP